jgi:hypothetical protein
MRVQRSTTCACRTHLTFCRRRWRAAAGEIHDQLPAFHEVEAGCDRFSLICRTFVPSITVRSLTRLDEVEMPWAIAVRDTEDEPCHAPQARLPSRPPNLLICRHFLERMKGLEPSTFCMANASDRSLLFASVRSNRLFAEVSMQASEQDRTRANAEPCHSCHGLTSRWMIAPKMKGAANQPR